jgi:hypothetical protein
LDSRRTASASDAGQGISLPYAYAKKVEPSQTDARAAISLGLYSGGATGVRTVDRSSLPVFAPVLVAFKLRSQYRLSDYGPDRVLELLLLFITVEAHEPLNRFFGIHKAMVAQGWQPVGPAECVARIDGRSVRGGGLYWLSRSTVTLGSMIASSRPSPL